MKMNLLLVGVSAIIIVGCDSKPTATNDANSVLKPVSTSDKFSPTPDTNSNNAPASDQKTGMDLSKIPADLKSDAFEYYGLGRTEPIKMSVNQNGTAKDASQTVRLTDVKDGKAEFTISNEGGLAQLGEVIVSLDKEGIKVVSVNGQKAETETFELPTNLKPGKTWPFKLQSNDMKLTGTNVVKGTESVTTPVGTYKDALLVVSTATGNQGSQKVQLKSKQWLVKGRGQVKAEITNVSGKTTQTVTMSESK